MSEPLQPFLKEEGGYAVIRIPMGEIAALRVALAECPCRATKSIKTKSLRQRLATALGTLEER